VIHGRRSLALIAAGTATLACQQAPNGNGNAAAIERVRANAMQYIDLRNPSVTTPVKADTSATAARFVVVEIASVANPRSLPLTFDVAFRSDGRELALGSFSLYPPNNPGRFIVATQGKVRPGGEIVVTLDREGLQDIGDIRVGVRAVYLGQR
jgi:hypothetical protein